ncbi:MarR family winged helix-turn-helix transcriptional regulator [Rhizobium ruizarguesonis]
MKVDAARSAYLDIQAREHVSLPFAESLGYQVRLTHRLIQKYLQQRIEPHGVTLGMWYFLRALWNEDGLTQKELSLIVGTMEPTTLSAIKAMEQGGLVKRSRNSDDKRKINIFLTARGQQLKDELMPIAKEVVDAAASGFTQREVQMLMQFLGAIQTNMATKIQPDTEA